MKAPMVVFFFFWLRWSLLLCAGFLWLRRVGLLFVVVCGLLIAVACLCCGARALGMRASVVVAHGLSSCGM